jgi:oxygen-independent coproporphyrinogen-3 oxidase
MDFGAYVHIPYCLQRCRYCDFTTFEFSEIMPPEKYLQILLREIRKRSSLFEPTKLASLYFGGGTPSLIPAPFILSIISELANCGFEIDSDSEVTIEINPATVNEEKLDFYIKSGINRFSVGAQSFNDDLLKLCGRRHLAEDTRHTLRLLRERSLNYSFDLLFALPSQTLDQLKQDLDEVELFDPPHLSAYCLTVPSGHPMAKNRRTLATR